MTVLAGMSRSLLFLLVMAVSALTASLQPRPASAQSITDNFFTGEERRIISGYYRAAQQSQEAPSGPARAGSRLPPAYAKLLGRGKPLPAGLYYAPLPSDLVGELPRRPLHLRLVIGTDILLVERSSNLVRDIMPDALRGR